MTDLSVLGDSMLAYKVWLTTESRYEWSGGTAPGDGFTNVVFAGPLDPATAIGGRDVNRDLWIDTSVPS